MTDHTDRISEFIQQDIAIIQEWYDYSSSGLRGANSPTMTTPCRVEVMLTKDIEDTLSKQEDSKQATRQHNPTQYFANLATTSTLSSWNHSPIAMLRALQMDALMITDAIISHNKLRPLISAHQTTKSIPTLKEMLMSSDKNMRVVGMRYAGASAPLLDKWRLNPAYIDVSLAAPIVEEFKKILAMTGSDIIDLAGRLIPPPDMRFALLPHAAKLIDKLAVNTPEIPTRIIATPTEWPVLFFWLAYGREYGYGKDAPYPPHIQHAAEEYEKTLK